MLVFVEGETGVSGEKLLDREFEPTTNSCNPHMASPPGFEPVPHWCEATTPFLLTSKCQVMLCVSLNNIYCLLSGMVSFVWWKCFSAHAQNLLMTLTMVLVLLCTTQPEKDEWRWQRTCYRMVLKLTTGNLSCWLNSTKLPKTCLLSFLSSDDRVIGWWSSLVENVKGVLYLISMLNHQTTLNTRLYWIKGFYRAKQKQ